MLIHDFFVINKEYVDLNNVNFGVRYNIIYKTKALQYIRISDEFILDNADVLCRANATFTSVLDGRKGLNYYGETILCDMEIDNFIIDLNKIPDCLSKKMLLRMGKLAIENNCYLVHVGV